MAEAALPSTSTQAPPDNEVADDFSYIVVDHAAEAAPRHRRVEHLPTRIGRDEIIEQLQVVDIEEELDLQPDELPRNAEIRNALLHALFAELHLDDDDVDLAGLRRRDEMMQTLLQRLYLGVDVDVSEIDTRPTAECRVCLDVVQLGQRPCCDAAVCDDCLRTYVETELTDVGHVRIVCPIPSCNSVVYQDEVRRLLRTNDDLRGRYDRWLIDLNGDPRRKTCPRCCRVTELQQVDDDSRLKDRKTVKYGLQVECEECKLEWCFLCQAPWHVGLTCKQYRAGDVLLKNWAHEKSRGQHNAQRCPKCKTYIQKSTGCDHMKCTRCNTKFCYRCGGRRLRPFSAFGVRLEDHDMKHSILGCNDKYKPDHPVQRAVSRGAIFGAKLVAGVVAAPVAVGLLAGAAGIVVGVGAVALPAYGCYRLAKSIKSARRRKRDIRRRRADPTIPHVTFFDGDSIYNGGFPRRSVELDLPSTLTGSYFEHHRDSFELAVTNRGLRRTVSIGVANTL